MILSKGPKPEQCNRMIKKTKGDHTWYGRCPYPPDHQLEDGTWECTNHDT